MTDDFVTEADRAVQRLHKKRRMRQYVFGGGLAAFALATLFLMGANGFGAVAFVFLAAAVGLVLYLEWDGMRLERAMESVPVDGRRTHFVSGRDGLVFATDEQLFVEGRGRFYPFEDKRRSFGPVAYLGETHELRFELVPSPGQDPEAFPPLDVQLPRDMTPQAALRLANQLDGWTRKKKKPAPPVNKVAARP